VAERMIESNRVWLCAESFGEPSASAMLLITGTGASMLWWDEEFCRRLAAGGRFVVRYDHRDTGRSVTYEPGRPGYTGSDLVADAAGVLDALGIAAAHVVGVSSGAAMAQLLALDHPDRVRSLTLVSTSFAVASDRDLPPPVEAFGQFFSSARVDWSDADSVVDYQVAYARMLAGDQRPFDDAGVRALVRRDRNRARDYPALRNHDILPEDDRPHGPVSSITLPTLVIHGTADPLFPIEHGEALADAIPGAQLLRLANAGHGIDRTDWDRVVPAILEHTSRPEPT
jgi:pimeloyl-ACP methyl ester carboxylesterase